MQLGLVGYPLAHSFSKGYFERKFSELKLKVASYTNIEVKDAEQIKEAIAAFPKLQGFNITIPHKQTIVSMCHQLSEEAQAIGAINCVRIEGGKWIGHNTDFFGFKQSIKPFLEPHHDKALILGTGGSSKAVAYALKSVGVEVYFVSSQPKNENTIFTYSQLNEHILNAFKLIINTTPLGMSPNIEKSPEIPYHLLTPHHFCYDLIYNPEETIFLKQAKTRGALTMNGLSMLQLQAEKSWEIWTNNRS
jgi:shikimate dehydrogenase